VVHPQHATDLYEDEGGLRRQHSTASRRCIFGAMTALTITLQCRLQCTDHHCSATQPSEAPLCSPLPQHHLHSSSISSSEHSTRLPLHCDDETAILPLHCDDETATEMATMASARGHTNPRPCHRDGERQGSHQPQTRGPSPGLYSDCVLPAGMRTTWPPSFWSPSFLRLLCSRRHHTS
jgi:hypothetical protein